MDRFTLETLLTAIDAEFQHGQLPIHARPLNALSEFGRRTQIPTRLPRSRDEFGFDDFSDEALGSQIMRWYDARYGDRLKINFSPGSVAVLLRGVPWELRLPKKFAGVDLVVYRNIAESRKWPRLSTEGTGVRLNVLEFLVGLPDDGALGLSDSELVRIGRWFIQNLDLLESIDRKLPYIADAMADLKASVTMLVGHPPHYGLSQWSSLQFVEKVMKARLGDPRLAKKLQHDLEKLAAELRQRMQVRLNPALVAAVQCSSGVRYGEPSVTMTQAMAAHEAALNLVREITPHSTFEWEWLPD